MATRWTRIGRRGSASAAFLCLGGEQKPQFLRPIRKRHAETLDVGMAGQQQRLDFRNLPAATLDSCRCLSALLRDLLERPPVGLEGGLFAGQRLPALDDD